MILECEGYYSAESLMDELTEIAFDHLHEPNMLEHVEDAQRHVDCLLNGY